jgi:hypothetical protein
VKSTYNVVTPNARQLTRGATDSKKNQSGTKTPTTRNV